MDRPTKIAMNTIVCHAGAMREGIDGREGRFASALTVSKIALWEVKLRHPVAPLMIQINRRGEWSILHRPEVIPENVELTLPALPARPPAWQTSHHPPRHSVSCFSPGW